MTNIKKIKDLRSSGLSLREIAEKLNVSRGTIEKILAKSGDIKKVVQVEKLPFEDIRKKSEKNVFNPLPKNAPKAPSTSAKKVTRAVAKTQGK